MEPRNSKEPWKSLGACLVVITVKEVPSPYSAGTPPWINCTSSMEDMETPLPPRTRIPSTMVCCPSERLPRTLVMAPSTEETPSRFASALVTERPGVVRMLSPDIRLAEVVLSWENTGGSHVITTSSMSEVRSISKSINTT